MDYQCIKVFFSGVVNMITQALKLILLELRTWCDEHSKSMFNLHRKKTSFCWMIELLYEFIMNMPDTIWAMYIVDITQCYKKIPLEGFNNLHEALDFATQKGFAQHNGSSCQHSIWVHINTGSGLADHANGIQSYQALPIGLKCHVTGL